VRLILPKYSDWPTYILASEYLYDFFLKNSVEIYQWNLGNHHGKLALIDDNFTTIGSFNLNYTSYQQNLEMNVNIYSSVFASFVKDQMEELIKKNCTKLSLDDFTTNANLKTRFLRFYYYLILSMISNFSVGLIYQEQLKKENQIFSFLRILTSLLFFILGIFGLVLPFFPGIPFFLISFLLIYKQIIFNRKFE
jgi:cardiolipin synthase